MPRPSTSVPHRGLGRESCVRGAKRAPRTQGCAPNPRDPGARDDGGDGCPGPRHPSPIGVWGAKRPFGARKMRPERTGCAPNPRDPGARDDGGDGCPGPQHPSPTGVWGAKRPLGRETCAPMHRMRPKPEGIPTVGMTVETDALARSIRPHRRLGRESCVRGAKSAPRRHGMRPKPEGTPARGTGATSTSGCRGAWAHRSEVVSDDQVWRRSWWRSFAACTTSGPSRRSSARSRCTTRPSAVGGRPSTRGSAAATETLPRVISSRVVA